ncbi:hypothetical protein HGRIS_011964 [Hohenbuehelia grisea]|uniref:Uncharacterized protein n=1 Tax=Hohenbuehelia grisea TaxID=104357 RepID=A0ABR3JYR8_9AGAR
MDNLSSPRRLHVPLRASPCDFENTFEIFISNQLKRLRQGWLGRLPARQLRMVTRSLPTSSATVLATRLPTLSPSEGYTPHPRVFQRVLQRTSHQRTLLERIGRLQPYSHQPVLLRLRLASLRRSRAVCGPALQPGAMSRTLLLKATLGVQRELRRHGPSGDQLTANTVYVFTGQSSQESGMGMDLYNLSAATLLSGMVLTPIYSPFTASPWSKSRQGQPKDEDHPLW